MPGSMHYLYSSSDSLCVHIWSSDSVCVHIWSVFLCVYVCVLGSHPSAWLPSVCAHHCVPKVTFPLPMSCWVSLCYGAINPHTHTPDSPLHLGPV